MLLTLTFPRLRIIWSSSPYATSDIFADLKLNRDEPDAAIAGTVGADEVGDVGSGDREATVNQTPQELLRSLPGIVSFRNFLVLQLSWLRVFGATDCQELQLYHEGGRQYGGSRTA